MRGSQEGTGGYGIIPAMAIRGSFFRLAAFRVAPFRLAVIAAGVALLLACGGEAATPAPVATPVPTSVATPEATMAPVSTPEPAQRPSPAQTPSSVDTPAPADAPEKTTVTEGGITITQYSAPPPMTIDQDKSYTATIQTNHGDLVIELFPKEAPISVNNFVFLAREGFYDGVVFHRIIADFMIQGGDPTGTGRGGPGYRFQDEKVMRPYVRGTLAMANAGPNTNGSQFFIVHQDYPLPPNYNVFGLVREGFDVLDALATVAVGGPQRSDPLEPQVIHTIQIAEE